MLEQLESRDCPTTLTWNNPADITYGTVLGGGQLNASADVSGVFTFSPALGVILHAGNSQELSASFTPDDPNDAPATAIVDINVLPATLLVRANDNSKTYGSANPALTVSYSGFVNGDTVAALTSAASASTSATTASNAGAYTMIAPAADRPAITRSLTTPARSP